MVCIPAAGGIAARVEDHRHQRILLRPHWHIVPAHLRAHLQVLRTKMSRTHQSIKQSINQTKNKKTKKQKNNHSNQRNTYETTNKPTNTRKRLDIKACLCFAHQSGARQRALLNIVATVAAAQIVAPRQHCRTDRVNNRQVQVIDQRHRSLRQTNAPESLRRDSKQCL